MATVTVSAAPALATEINMLPTVSLKKSVTPSGMKRKIVATVVKNNSENAENQQQQQQPINSSSVLAKKTFTGINVNVTALSTNKANIINNNQQPKARTSPKTSAQTAKSVSIINQEHVDVSKPVKTVLPQAVARRNARERNRVKQVNNGFAALRQHIPEEMAEAFELHKGTSPASNSCGTGGGTTNSAQKKLSKVETLRMAVEYIRNLEGLLNISSSNSAVTAAEHSFSFCDTSSLVSNSPSSPSCSNSSMIDEDTSLHPAPKQLISQIQPQLLSFDDSLSIDQSHVVLPSMTTINGIPYLRLPPNQNHLLGQDFSLEQTNTGDFIVVSTTSSDQSDFHSSGDEEQQHQLIHHHQQHNIMYQTVSGVDQQQPNQPILLYTTPVESSSNFQSNFVVNNNLLAPAASYQGALPTTTTVSVEEFNGRRKRTSGQSTAARSPVPDGDQIKIEQQPSRGGFNSHNENDEVSSTVYGVNKSPLIRQQQLQCDRDTLSRRVRTVEAEEESPAKRLCTGNEQFSVVDQSGVIIRGNFIEIKQEQIQQQQQHHHLHQHQFHIEQSPSSAVSDEFLAGTTDSLYDSVHDRLVHLKREIPDEDEADLSLLETNHINLTEEHMIDAMEWWENEKKAAQS